MIHEHDCIVLTQDITDERLKAGDVGTEAPVGEAGHGVDGDTQSADQGHRARIPEAQSVGSFQVRAVPVGREVRGTSERSAGQPPPKS